MKSFPTIVLASLICISTGVLSAQDLSYRADRKITGQYYLPHTARTYQRSAINHAQVLQYYGKTNTAIPSDVAKTHATEIRHNLDATMKEIAKLEPEIKGDKQAQELVAGIKAHHTKASEHCGMLEEECKKHEVAGATLAGRCANMAKELNAADELHDKLMNHLKVPVQEQTKK